MASTGQAIVRRPACPSRRDPRAVRVAAKAAVEDNWQRRRVEALRAASRSTPSSQPPSTPGRKARRVPDSAYGAAGPPRHTNLATEQWQEELARRANRSAAVGSTKPSVHGVPQKAGIKGPMKSGRAVPNLRGKEGGDTDGEDEDDIPARLKRSAIPKPYQLPAVGVRVSRKSGQPVVRSKKKRNTGPDSIGQAYEKGLKAMQSGKGTEPSAEEPPKQRSALISSSRARRRNGSGAANPPGTLFSASLVQGTNLELDKLLFASSRPLDRGVLGQGKLHWYKLECAPDRESSAIWELESAGFRAVLPVAKREHRSDSGRRSWRKIKYEEGTAVLILHELHEPDIEAMEYLCDLPWCHYHTHYRSESGRKFVLPIPLSKEEIAEVHKFESQRPASRGETDFERMEKMRFAESGHYSPPVKL